VIALRLPTQHPARTPIQSVKESNTNTIIAAGSDRTAVSRDRADREPGVLAIEVSSGGWPERLVDLRCVEVECADEVVPGEDRDAEPALERGAPRPAERRYIIDTAPGQPPSAHPSPSDVSDVPKHTVPSRGARAPRPDALAPERRSSAAVHAPRAPADQGQHRQRQSPARRRRTQ